MDSVFMEKTGIEADVVIEDIYIRCSLTEENTAQIWLTVWIENESDQDKPLKLRVGIADRGNNIASAEGRIVVQVNDISEITLQVTVENPKLWSAQSPFLYDVVLDVYNHYDDMLAKESVSYGIREVSVEDGDLHINSQRAVLNEAYFSDYERDWDFEPSKENYIAYFKHLKNYNINCIWTGYELEDHTFFDLCDMYGFYVIVQGHIEVGPKLVKHLRNHPSIVLWHFDDGGKHDQSERLNRILFQDYSRPIIYEGKQMPTWIKSKNAYELSFDTNAESVTVSNGICTDPDQHLQICFFTLLEGEASDEVKELIDLRDGSCSVSIPDIIKTRAEKEGSQIGLYIRTAQNNLWSKAGQILAGGLLGDVSIPYVETPLEHSGFCKIDELNEFVRVKGSFGELEISKATGFISQITVQGTEMLQKPIRPNFWRSSVDTDPKGETKVKWIDSLTSRDRWKYALETLKVKSVTHNLASGIATIEVMAGIRGVKGVFEMVYQIGDNGEFTISYGGTASSDMNRIGLALETTAAVGSVNFAGIGPQTHVGISPVRSLFMAHNLTQDVDGTYDRIHWFSFSDHNDKGFMFEKMEQNDCVVHLEEQELVFEAGYAPLKMESFQFSAKCLLLFD